MEPVVDDGEQNRLAESESDDRDGTGADEPAQVGRGADVGEPGAELAPAGAPRARGAFAAPGPARRACFAPPAPSHRCERGGRGEEGRRIERGDGRAADRGEQPRARQRRQQPQRLAHALQGGVAVTHELAREDGDEEGGLAGALEGGRGAERGHHRVDDPHIAGVVDEHERRDGERAGEVDRDEQRPLGEAIDQQAGDR